MKLKNGKLSAFSQWNLSSKTREKVVKVFQNVKKIIGLTNHILVFRYQSKLCMLGMQAGAGRKSLFGALSLFLRSVTKGAHVLNFAL